MTKKKGQKIVIDGAKVVAHSLLPTDSVTVTTFPLEHQTVATESQVYAAQRVAAKVAKALKRPRVGISDQLAIAHMALLAIAAGPKSTARDIAVTALKVVG